MSETDPVTEVEELEEPEYPGDTGEPEDEPTEPEDEGTVEEQAEETPEEPEETGDEPPSEDDGVPDLSMFPEDQRELVQKYGDQRIAGIQSSWQEKIEAAKAAAEEAAEAKRALAAYNEAMEKNPRQFIMGLIKHADEQGLLQDAEEGPPDPGEMPDPMDTAAWRPWFN